MSTTSSDIFSTVSKKDYLSLFKNDTPNYQGVTNFLGFKKEDISKATGIALGSIRYDEKSPTQLRERMREWANLLNLVAEYFQGDDRKTVLWFTMPNPFLGNVSPRDMIRFGRYRKLLKFIVTAIAENR